MSPIDRAIRACWALTGCALLAASGALAVYALAHLAGLVG